MFFTRIIAGFLGVSPHPGDSYPNSSCLSVARRIFPPFPLQRPAPTAAGLLPRTKREASSCPFHPPGKGVGHSRRDALSREGVVSFLLLFGESGDLCDRNGDNLTGNRWTCFMRFRIRFSVPITWKLSVPFFWLWSKSSSRDNTWIYIFKAWIF